MSAEDKILAFLKEHGGVVKRGQLAKLNVNPVTLGRAVRSLIIHGHVDACLRITEAGMLAKPKHRGRKRPDMPNYGLIKGPPQHVFKEVSEDDINRIRDEALSARMLVPALAVSNTKV